MSTHNICFYGEIRKLSLSYHEILFLNSSSITRLVHMFEGYHTFTRKYVHFAYVIIT